MINISDVSVFIWLYIWLTGFNSKCKFARMMDLLWFCRGDETRFLRKFCRKISFLKAF